MDLTGRICCRCDESLMLNQTDVNIQTKCLGISPESLLCLTCLEKRHEEKHQEHLALMDKRHALGVAKEHRRRKRERDIQKQINRTMNGR